MSELASESSALRPQEDWGFFGPESPTWKVWSHPTALIGFQRSVVLEHFDPDLAAAVADSAGIYTDPARRLDHTLAYFLTVATADGATAIAASEHLQKVHARATGIEPISGRRYSANAPASQLWIHVTGWHSVLKCYEMYGPGPLTPAEEQRYWRESVIAAELQTCRSSDVPASRAEVREYFAQVRPRLCSSERAHAGMHYLLRTPWRKGGGRFAALSRLIAPATIASLPAWMGEVGGFGQPAVVGRAYRPAVRAAIAATTPSIALALLSSALPATSAVYRRHHFGPPPLHRTIVTPEEARTATRTLRLAR